MAVATVASASSGSFYTTSVTGFNCGAGAFVVGTTWDTDGTDDATGTYNAVSMTRSASIAGGDSVPLLTINGQTSGAKDFVVSTGTNNWAFIASFSGVDATTPIRGSAVTANNGGGATNTVSFSIASDAADLVLIAYLWRGADGNVSLSAGSKLVYLAENTHEMGFITVPGASTVNVTLTGVYNGASVVGVSLKDAGTGGGGVGSVSDSMFHRRAALSVLHV